MSNNRSKFEQNMPYHIYNRWFEKQRIFHEEKDYLKFMEYMSFHLLDHPKLVLVCYCLLPNHFHLILKETGLGNWRSEISDLLRKIQWSYAMYFMAKYKETFYKRRQWLYEGRFKAKPLILDDYLAMCINYIIFNPVKHWITINPDEWIYKWMNETGLQR